MIPGIGVTPDLDVPSVASPDGMDWGRIPECLAPYPRVEPIHAGRVIVPIGNVAEGYNHVLRKHGRNIAGISGMNVDQYLCDVLRHFQRIYLQRDGSLWLFRRNGITKCAVLAPCVISGEKLYRLITAYPIARLPNFQRRGAVELKFE